MPIFRIMGGNSSRSAATNFTSHSNPAAASSSSSAANNASSNRHTYPGMRVSSGIGPTAAGAAPPPLSNSMFTPPNGMPSVPPRMGGGSTSSSSSFLTAGGANPAMMMSTAAGGPSSVVIRGSAVGGNPASSSSSSMRASAPPQTGSNPAASQPPPAAAAASSTPTSRPGAYAVTRTTSGPGQVYRVTVPPGVRPGSEFTVHAGTRRVRVRCPPTSRPGHSLQITLPPEPTNHNQLLKIAPLTSSTTDGKTPGGGAVPMTPEVRKVNQNATDSGGTAQTFLVTIPQNIYPGMQFTVNVPDAGQRFMVTCPPNAGPNMRVRIVPPTPVREEPMAAPTTQVFEVTVPNGVRPNQPFTLMANGQRVLVTCPPNVVPGQRIRFQLPVHQIVGNIQLSYESEKSSGWCRTVRVNDLKFQWVRMNKNDEDDNKEPEMSGSVEAAAASGTNTLDDMKTFDFGKAAYVRKLQFLEGNDARMRTGQVTLIPAQEAVVESRLNYNNKTLLSYADIANVQTKSLDDKSKWFQNICKELLAEWDDGHVKIVVRRHSLLNDSVDAVMSLGREDMRKRWRIEFLGEPGIDAGGVTREWFQLLTEQIFDPDFGLWLSSVNNQMCMTINPASNISCPDDHLVYFRFLGRILGRALFDQQLVKGHMARHIYKHLLGWPITFDDLETQDEEYYNSLKKFTTMDDLSMMCLDFTITEETMGVRRDVELIPGGNMKEVTADNLPQYLEANLKYRMLERTRPQMTELLLGFYDIIPEPALTVFDPSEMELILCGLPEIEMEDWMSNTIYSGYYETKGRRDKVVEWFWDVVANEFDHEMKARLLQFVTGTSGVPTRGFSVLQGNDGNIKKFCVNGVSRDHYCYPRAHTCFNRIDLPNYASKKELYDKLKAAITLSSVGFDME